MLEHFIDRLIFDDIILIDDGAAAFITALDFVAIVVELDV